MNFRQDKFKKLKRKMFSRTNDIDFIFLFLNSTKTTKCCLYVYAPDTKLEWEKKKVFQVSR